MLLYLYDYFSDKERLNVLTNLSTRLVEYSMRGIRGIVFPVPHRFVDRLFSGEKDVFVKWGRFKYLESGQRLVFYDSGIHRLVGEARIQEVSDSDPATVWRMYEKRIFLEKNEFEAYVARSPLGYPRSSKRSKLVAITFKDARRYTAPKGSAKRMTAAGHYLKRSFERAF